MTPARSSYGSLIPASLSPAKGQQRPGATLPCLRWGLSLLATGWHGFQAKLRLSPVPAPCPGSRCFLEPGWGWRQVLRPVGLPLAAPHRTPTPWPPSCPGRN